MSEIEDLVHRADLDGLVRLVDRFCSDADWGALVDEVAQPLPQRRQHWQAAEAVAGSDAGRVTTRPLWAPAEWAALVLDEGSGTFTIGPLTEVVAQHHRFDELHARLPGGPRLGFVAHECALRGQSISNEVANPLEIPFELQPWEPAYGPGEYSR